MTQYVTRIRLIFGGLLATILVSIFLIGSAVYFSSPSVVAYIEREKANLIYTIFFKYTGRRVTTSNTTIEGNAQSVPVLAYHGEGEDTDMPTALFIDHLRALKSDGWNTITLKQFYAFIKEGAPVPAKSFVLTFDDGRKDTFYHWDPVLADLGFTATMFVITGLSLPANGQKSNYYLNQQELDFMARSGRWELESHGDLDHPLYAVPSSEQATSADTPGEHFLSNKFWLPSGRIETTTEFTKRITNDLTLSKQILEKKFGKPVVAFAFPFNDYGQNTVNFPGSRDIIAEVTRSLYPLAFYQVSEDKENFFNYPDPEAFMIKRIEPTAQMNGDDLTHLLNASATKSLPYVSTAFGLEWISNWGDVQPEGEMLTLRATAKTGGAAALLNGSELWRDYTITAQLQWIRGDYVSLIARYQSDSKTFLSCVFSRNAIMLKAHQNGIQKIIVKKPLTSDGLRDVTIAMTAHAHNVGCTLQEVTITARVNDSFVHGGQIGVQIWDPTLGISELQVHRVSVEPL